MSRKHIGHGVYRDSRTGHLYHRPKYPSWQYPGEYADK